MRTGEILPRHFDFLVTPGAEWWPPVQTDVETDALAVTSRQFDAPANHFKPRFRNCVRNLSPQAIGDSVLAPCTACDANLASQNRLSSTCHHKCVVGT